MPGTPDDADASIEDAHALVNEAREIFVRQLRIVNRWPHAQSEQAVLLAAFNDALQAFMIRTMHFVNERPEFADGEPPYPFAFDATKRTPRYLCCGVLRGEPHDTTCPATGGK